MGLSLLNALPDREAQFRSLQQELLNRNRQLNEAEEALRQEKQKNATIEAGVQQLRTVLSPLFQALQLVFGEIDAMGVGGSTAVEPQKKAIWEDWKNKLDPQCAKAIDALLIHGEMNQTQLRLHVKCAKGSVAGIVFRLNRAGLINKN